MGVTYGDEHRELPVYNRYDYIFMDCIDNMGLWPFYACNESFWIVPGTLAE